MFQQPLLSDIIRRQLHSSVELLIIRLSIMILQGPMMLCTSIIHRQRGINQLTIPGQPICLQIRRQLLFTQHQDRQILQRRIPIASPIQIPALMILHQNIYR